MASDTFKVLITGLVLFVLFSSLILTLTIGLGNEYDRSADEIGGGTLNVSVFEENIEDVDSSSEGLRERFEEGNLDDVDDVTGIFGVVKDMIGLITTPFQLLSQVLSNLLNVPAIFINVVLGILSLSLILAIWGLLRKGD